MVLTFSSVAEGGVQGLQGFGRVAAKLLVQDLVGARLADEEDAAAEL